MSHLGGVQKWNPAELQMDLQGFWGVLFFLEFIDNLISESSCREEAALRDPELVLFSAEES